MSSSAQPGVAESRRTSANADDVRRTRQDLLRYCQSRHWAGHDPYDALNSRLFTAMPMLDSKWPRLVVTQALKRSPVNIRGLLFVPETQNPKAMALFLGASLRMADLKPSIRNTLVQGFVDRLVAMRSAGNDHWCWGYSFPWQTRTLVVPRGAPNLVCTTFVANALLDAYEQTRDSRCLTMAVSASRYILDELFWTEEDSAAGFAYPMPSIRVHIHNANLLGAALFCRVFRLTGDRRFVEPALKVARYSASRQHPDGSWAYGEAQTQQWIDNFHTGYNLGALRDIGQYLGSTEFETRVRQGFEFYRAHFFREDGAPRYFHDNTYPIDIHCVAQSIITLVSFRHLHPDNLRLAHEVFRWAKQQMWDEGGYFYYRVLRFGRIKTSYMRWSQAWMLLAISVLVNESDGVGAELSPPHSAVSA
jgi:hypothetical protein